MRVAFVQVPDVTKILDFAGKNRENILTPVWKLIVPAKIVTYTESANDVGLYRQFERDSELSPTNKPNRVEVLTSQQLSVLFSKVRDYISLSVAEAILAWLSIYPFLGIARSNLSKLASIRKDGNILRI